MGIAVNLNYDDSNHEKYLTLKEGKGKRGILFRTMKSIYITSALIAMKFQLKPSPLNKKHDFIKNVQLAEKEISILTLIALAYSNNIQILENDVEIFNITDELANAGFPNLYDEIVSKPGDWLTNLIDYCDKEFWGVYNV